MPPIQCLHKAAGCILEKLEAKYWKMKWYLNTKSLLDGLTYNTGNNYYFASCRKFFQAPLRLGKI